MDYDETTKATGEKGNCYDLRNFAFLGRKEAWKKEEMKAKTPQGNTVLKKGTTFDQKNTVCYER